MSVLTGLNVPGVVGAIRRRVGLHLETLLLCDAARGDGAATEGRGFYKLLSVCKGQLPVLGPRITVYEPASKGGALRPYRFSSFLSCAAFCAGSGLTFFAQGHEIYTLDANNVIRRLFGDTDVVGRSSGLKLCYPSALAIPDPETLYVTDAYGLHILRLAPSPLEDGVVVVSARTLHVHDEDRIGQFGVACGSGSQVMFSARAVYKAGPDGGWQLWAGNDELGGNVNGAWREARFSSITAVAIDGIGSALVLDAQPDGRTVVRRVDVDGYVKTLYHPIALDESNSCGDVFSCDSRSMSPYSLSCSACSGIPAAAPFESAFLGGGLRCPLVQDNFLVLCAPLQGFILFLHVSGLRELPFQAGLKPARACTYASCSNTAHSRACRSGDAWCGNGVYRAGQCAHRQSATESVSCSSSSSCYNSDYTMRHRACSSKDGWYVPSVENNELQSSYSAAVTELVQLQEVEDEVSSQATSCAGSVALIQSRCGKRGKSSSPNLEGKSNGRKSPAHKRARAL